MNREQEHSELLNELLSSPSVLDGVFTKAEARVKKRAIIRNSITVPLTSLLSLFIIFAVLVNISPAVASAMENVPGLRRLAEFVTFSPSFTEAVEHGFVQHVGYEQIISNNHRPGQPKDQNQVNSDDVAIQDDLIMRLEYVIVDGQQIHIFFTLDSLFYTNMGLSITGSGAATVDAAECCQYTSIPGDCCRGLKVQADMILFRGNEKVNNELNYITIGFEDLVPPVIIWEGYVLDNNDIVGSRGRSIGRYFFVIDIDEIFSEQDIFHLHYDFILDGQLHTITTVELNPAHTRVNIESDWMNNTEHLQRLVFYIVNEHGRQFNPPAIASGGIVCLPIGGSGDDGPWRMGPHFLETAFFSESESLTLVITGVEWIGMEWFGPDTIWLEEPIEIRVK